MVGVGDPHHRGGHRPGELCLVVQDQVGLPLPHDRHEVLGPGRGGDAGQHAGHEALEAGAALQAVLLGVAGASLGHLPLEAEPGREGGEAGFDHTGTEVTGRGEGDLVAGSGQGLGERQHGVEVAVPRQAGGEDPHGRTGDPLAIIVVLRRRAAPRLG